MMKALIRCCRHTHRRAATVPRHPGLIVIAALMLLSRPAAADAVETSGTVLRVAIPASALALTFVNGDREGRVQFYESFATNIAATWLLKELVDRERPDGSGDDAFPSGHTTMAFQGASFIHRRYGLRTAWPAYALAAWTGWTRIEAGEHDAADVLAGAALGVASSYLFTDRFENVEVSVRLDGQFGIRINGSF
jgi:membrane-associated phospholipid phosphatase